ncbi:hypothetical protein BDZ88DRAFT_456432 [Geranomyces variabilis]|nr:hypothetical protein BDZ88DRAFT_456432 [Geranomyces variabilis]KAJ3131143.1 hypothetical protein HDU90_008692 [Geranomyces variabilis]
MGFRDLRQRIPNGMKTGQSPYWLALGFTILAAQIPISNLVQYKKEGSYYAELSFTIFAIVLTSIAGVLGFVTLTMSPIGNNPLNNRNVNGARAGNNDVQGEDLEMNCTGGNRADIGVRTENNNNEHEEYIESTENNTNEHEEYIESEDNIENMDSGENEYNIEVTMACPTITKRIGPVTRLGQGVGMIESGIGGGKVPVNRRGSLVQD